MENFICAIWEGKRFPIGACPYEKGQVLKVDQTCLECSYYQTYLCNPEKSSSKIRCQYLGGKIIEKQDCPLAEENRAEFKLDQIGKCFGCPRKMQMIESDQKVKLQIPKVNPVEFRLRTLVGSKPYHKAFDELKRKIFARKGSILENHDRSLHQTYGEAKGWKRMDYMDIPLAKLKEILDGNINAHEIRFPYPTPRDLTSVFRKDFLSDFRDRWDMEYFFDPSKPYSRDLDPFKSYNRGPVDDFVPLPLELLPAYERLCDKKLLSGRGSPLDDHLKMYVAIDLRYRESVIIEHLRDQIRFHKRVFRLTSPRSDRYPPDRIAAARKLLEEGQTARQISKTMCSEDATRREKKKTQRIIQKAREGIRTV